MQTNPMVTVLQLQSGPTVMAVGVLSVSWGSHQLFMFFSILLIPELAQSGVVPTITEQPDGGPN